MAAPRVVADVTAGAVATLIFDGMGRVCGCGVAAENLFGASQSRLIGRNISELTAGIVFNETSPDHSASQVGWQICEAMDAHGIGFLVETHLSRKMTGGQAVFVLKLRRPGEGSCA